MSSEISSSVKKLYSCISQGLGGRIIPSEIRRMLDNEYSLIEVQGDSEFVPSIIAENEMAFPEAEKLYKNTCSRLLYQEMKKQKNIENVVAKTAEILAEKNEESEEGVDEDWITRFFNSIQDVSSERMQNLWSRILAGEINNPNTYSLRTLDAMTKMSTQEATLFESIYPYVIDIRGTLAVINNDEINERFGIPYQKIIRLSECGLIESSAIMSITLTVDMQNPFKSVYGDCYLEGVIKESNTKVSVSIYKLTTIGVELFGILNKSYNYDYFNEIENYLARNNPSVCFVEHKIIERFGNQFRYEINGKEIKINQE